MALNRCELCARNVGSVRPDYGGYPKPKQGDRCEGCGRIYEANDPVKFMVSGQQVGRRKGRWRPLTALEMMKEAIDDPL